MEESIVAKNNTVAAYRSDDLLLLEEREKRIVTMLGRYDITDMKIIQRSLALSPQRSLGQNILCSRRCFSRLYDINSNRYICLYMWRRTVIRKKDYV